MPKTKKKKLVGVTLATAAALTFASVPATSALADSTSKGVECFGVNACKGQGQCKTASSACAGQNACNGKGVIIKQSAEDCAKAGGKVNKS